MQLLLARLREILRTAHHSPRHRLRRLKIPPIVGILAGLIISAVLGALSVGHKRLRCNR